MAPLSDKLTANFEFVVRVILKQAVALRNGNKQSCINLRSWGQIQNAIITGWFTVLVICLEQL